MIGALVAAGAGMPQWKPPEHRAPVFGYCEGRECICPESFAAPVRERWASASVNLLSENLPMGIFVHHRSEELW